jgi:hypothetical protein
MLEERTIERGAEVRELEGIARGEEELRNREQPSAQSKSDDVWTLD